MLLTVRLRPVQPNIPADGQEWQEIRHEEEAAGQAPI